MIGFSVISVDPYLFPARGRKRRGRLDTATELGSVDPYLFPARGRKRVKPKKTVITSS